MQSNSESFYENKTKKQWVDEKTGRKGIEVYARGLYVTMGNLQYWDWTHFKEQRFREEKIEVVKLIKICWFDVRGKLKLSELSPTTTYEISYLVKLTKNAYGWDLPVTLRLSFPNGPVIERHVSLLDCERGEWVKLKLGRFFSGDDGAADEVCFDLINHGWQWKSGLIVAAAVISPLL